MFEIKSESACVNRLPVFGTRQLVSLVYDFINTGRRFGQYWQAIWPIQVGDFVHMGRQFQNSNNKDIIHMYDLSNWPIPVGNLANTNWCGLFFLKHFTQRKSQKTPHFLISQPSAFICHLKGQCIANMIKNYMMDLGG